MAELEFDVVSEMPPKADRNGWAKLMGAIKAGKVVRLPIGVVANRSALYGQGKRYGVPVTVLTQDGYYYIKARNNND